jgi:dTDP-4-dehydrorhamnose reductase
MTELVVLGGSGQLGQALAREAQARGIAHVAFGRVACDIADAGRVERAIVGARLVVNCAAYTAVDRAEAEEELAHEVNAIGAGNVARKCADAAVPLVHISTDYVFDGNSPHPYREDDVPRPLNAYGRSKLLGEERVREFHQAHVILRTSWIFSAHGQNFVTTMLRLARSESELRVIYDQVGGPTAAGDIAKAILKVATICKQPAFAGWGTYHFAGAPAVSWYEFARAIVGEGGPPVVPIAAAEFQRPARRPGNSVLDCSRIARVFGLTQPDWRTNLAVLLGTLASGRKVE